MPVCCRCNAGGRCRNCSCKKSGQGCINCLPHRYGRCQNTLTDPPEDDGQQQHSDISVNHQPAKTEREIERVVSPINAPSSPPPPPPPPLLPHTVDPPEFLHRLPPHPTLPTPNFMWGNIDGETFTNAICSAYTEIAHWRRNIFKVPSGRAGKAFVSELARLFRDYAEETMLEGIALKAAMTMPALLLQKPHQHSKSKDHLACLERRMTAWSDGDLASLLHEGRTIQRQLLKAHGNTKSKRQTAQSFAKLMMEGRVRAALRLLTDHDTGGSLPLDKLVDPNTNPHMTVRDILLEKHPPGQPLNPSALLVPDTPAEEPHPVIFDQLTGPLIRATALRTEGAAGPSGIDALGWRRLYTSFRGASSDLCEALAQLGRRICTTYVDPSGLDAFTACRLMALDKCPGVRPIGIGETARRILGKAILAVIGGDIQDTAGALQMCAGQQSGCEAAVHAMRQIFDDPNTHAVLLVDASNAFNNLNRQTALLNIHLNCPSIAKVLINTYRNNTQLFVGGETLLSQEGTTQGDPLAMAMYAISTLPLIRRLNQGIQQAWYADDATAGGDVHSLRHWWDMLREIGPEYGYFVNPSKTCLIVKEDHMSSATDLFQEEGIQITPQGTRHLGAALGYRSFMESYVSSKITNWVTEVEKLATIASSQPHAAYAALTHGLTGKWTYLARTVPTTSELFKPLEDVIRHRLIPALTGRSAGNDAERELLSLPTRLGGLGITNPSELTNSQYMTSQQVTVPLVALIIQQSDDYPYSAIYDQHQALTKAKSDRRQQQSGNAASLYPQLPQDLQRAVDAAKERGASNWLTTLPIDEHGFALHKGAFRDALCLRYGWRPSRLATECVCGKTFTVDHALSCPRGGFPALRHNEIRDLTAQLLSETCPCVSTEPELQPLSGETLTYSTSNTQDGARLDVRAEGFWGDRHQSAFFDVRVFNPLAPSNRCLTPASCYRKHEREKRRAYDQSQRDRTWVVHTPGFLRCWWNGKRSYRHLLKTGFSPSNKAFTAL